MMAISAMIEHFRLLRKMSIQELAQRAEISEKTILNLESGSENITLKTLINISDALDIKVTDLLRSSED